MAHYSHHQMAYSCALLYRFVTVLLLLILISIKSLKNFCLFCLEQSILNRFLHHWRLIKVICFPLDVPVKSWHNYAAEEEEPTLLFYPINPQIRAKDSTSRVLKVWVQRMFALITFPAMNPGNSNKKNYCIRISTLAWSSEFCVWVATKKLLVLLILLLSGLFILAQHYWWWLLWASDASNNNINASRQQDNIKHGRSKRCECERDGQLSEIPLGWRWWCLSPLLCVSGYIDVVVPRPSTIRGAVGFLSVS